MSLALASATQPLLLELHETLRELDPARWRAEKADAIRQRLNSLRRRFEAARNGASGADPHTLERVVSLEARLEEPAPASAQVEPWVAFRARIAPAYEALVSALQQHRVRVPSLRPTNYTRSVLHMLNGAGLLVLLALVPSNYLIYPATCAALLVWMVEGTRRISDTWNARVMRLFGPVAHAYEYGAINSGTWYVTALFVLALLQDPGASAAGIAVLAFADPAAGLIGRRFGRTKLIGGRSLEGSAAFVVVGFIAAFGALAWLMPASLGTMALLALVAAVAGAAAELLSGPIDDNLSIPVVAAFAVMALAAAS